MHYSDQPSMVRVDFWKVSPAGRFKWSRTAAVKWTGGYDGDIFRAFAERWTPRDVPGALPRERPSAQHPGR